MFRKLIVGTLLSACALIVSAGQTQIDTTGLNDAQIAELKAHAANSVAQVAKSVENPGQNSTAIVSLAATWGQQAAVAAEGFAKAFNIAAKELGVTINDFLRTDAGKLTAILIIWKVAGAAFIKILYGILFMSIGLCGIRILYYRLFTKNYEKVIYTRFFGMFTGEKLVRVPKTINQLETEGEWMSFWVLIIAVVVVLIFGGAFFT